MAEEDGESAIRGESGRALVFVSYASQDAAVATHIVDALERNGLTCWIAPRDVTPGTFYGDEIVHAIDAAKALVLILSSHAAHSAHVLREVERAASKRLALISLRIDHSALPSSLEYFLNTSQWLEAGGDQTDLVLPKLVTAVRLAIEKPNSDAEIKPTSVVDSPASSRVGRRLPPRKVALGAVAIAGIAGLAYWSWRSLHPMPAHVAPSVAAVPPAVPALSKKSVAVLPFENLSGRAEDAYLADGLQEEILNALARLRNLKVISRTSVLAFRDHRPNVREIGRQLGVGSILEGSIRRDGNILRLTVQLIDTQEDRHLLAANYDRDLAHVLTLQSAVARQIAEVLAAALTRDEKGELDRVATNNGDAYNLYLRAQALFRRATPSDESGVIEPKRLLEEALRLDPEFADAYALLSQADTRIYFESRRPENGAQAKQAFERALAIDPQLPEARLARGLYAMYVVEDLDQAVGDLEGVIGARPNSAAAHLALGSALRRQGRMAEALEQFMRATDLDPLNHEFSVPLLTTLLGLRRYPEAIAEVNLHAQRFHDHVFVVRARIECLQRQSVEPLRAVLREQGNSFTPEERNALESEVARMEGRFSDATQFLLRVPDTDALARASQLGFLYYAAGDEAQATQYFRSIERETRTVQRRGPVNSDWLLRLALAQSMLGEHAAALETIETARRQDPEKRDAVDGPTISFVRSVILVRAGRTAEGYEEVTRLMKVPFGAPTNFLDAAADVLLVLRGDSHYDALINHAPRL